MEKELKNKKRKGKRIFLIFLFSMIFLTVTGLIFAVFYAINLRSKIDFEADLALFELTQGSKTTRFYYNTRLDNNNVYYARELQNDRVCGDEDAIWASLDKMPDNLKNAFIAIEDHRFYEHSGVDYLRTAKAALNHITKSSSRFGGSTITQQLVKNISKDNDITVKRKVAEIFRAKNIEKNYNKDEILELYLNIVPLSHNCFGVQSAATKYFDKDVSELSLAECASIAAITNAPAKYDIISNPENNKYRRNLVLDAMQKYGYISEDECNNAKNEEISVKEGVKNTASNINSWYVDMVIEDVIKDLMKEMGYSREAAARLVYSGGLKIYTAMDASVQKTMERYFENKENFPLAKSNPGLVYSMIVTSPTGEILGVIGSQGEKNANRLLNYSTDNIRPIGSVIKPLSVYAPALEEKIISWASVYDDTPCEFRRENEAYKPWPQNSPGVYDGLTDIASAVKHSKNTVSVKVLRDLGSEKSYDYLVNGFGFSNILRSGYTESGKKISDLNESPMALGQLSYGESLKNTVGAYNSFYDGTHYELRSYIAVYDNKGELLLSNPVKSNSVFSRETAAIATKLMQGVVNGGTADYVKLKNHVEVAGKTGTTGGNLDKYFIGYTPYMVAGIYCGYENSDKPIITTSHFSVWDSVMQELHSEYIRKGAKSFEIPDTVIKSEYCPDSGKLCTDLCRLDPRGERCREGYFTLDTLPTEVCDRHVEVGYDRMLGGVCFLEDYGENLEKISLIRVEERDFPTEVYITDAQYVYRDLNGAMPAISSSKPFFANTVQFGRFAGISKTQSGKQFNSYAYGSNSENGIIMDFFIKKEKFYP